MGFERNGADSVTARGERTSMSLRVYAYSGCGTCKKAIRWLEERQIAYTVIPIREQPPTLRELKTVLKSMGGDVRKLFNTSGLDYRRDGIKDKLPSLTQDEALTLLASNGNLIKRPFVVDGENGTAGFNPGYWEATFTSS